MHSFRLSFIVLCYYSLGRTQQQLFVSSLSSSSPIAACAATRNSTDAKIRNLYNLTNEQLRSYAAARWNYHTDRNDVTADEELKSTIRLFLYQKLLIKSARNMSVSFGMKYEDLLPSIYFMHDRGVCQLDLSDYKTIVTLKKKLNTMVNELTVCEYRGKTNHPCDITANEIHFIMVNSTDTTELKHYWKAWHVHAGFDVKITYLKYIGTLKHMAKLNNFTNEVEYYTKPYLIEDYRLDVDHMYEGIRPLYLQLYTRVRRVLREKFGTVSVPTDGPIPAHLLGSVLGQPWTNFLLSTTHELFTRSNCKTQSKAIKRVFDQANKFFNSIGMGNVPKSVWSNSMFEEKDSFADCTPSSWDMYRNNDFRIKMCFRDTVEDVYTMHKQLGLVHYFSAYKKQPVTLQHTSDAAFVDGMINALTLSVRYQDFVDRFNDSAHSRHDYLLRTAAEKVAVLPFVYAAVVWHSDAFKGSFAPRRMNDLWWSKRVKYEGVVSPIYTDIDKCTDPNYKPFDPSAAMDMLTDLPQIRHFLGPIMEFQIFKALCTMCGEYESKKAKVKPLYECNLRGHKKVGKIIKSVMSKGSSIKWPLLFETIVGHQRLEVEPLLEYFQPLYQQLGVINSRTHEYVGWKSY